MADNCKSNFIRFLAEQASIDESTVRHIVDVLEVNEFAIVNKNSRGNSGWASGWDATRSIRAMTEWQKRMNWRNGIDS